MINFSFEPKYLTAHAEAQFLASLKSNSRKEAVKYQVLALLQTDCGLRVSEAVSLQVKNFDWLKNQIIVKCLKKKADVFRNVPMTSRLINSCAEYFKLLTDTKPDDYVFPSVNANSKSPYLSRIQVWKYFQSKSDDTINPHMLRHTAATKILEGGADLVVVRDLLGHSSTAVTQLYIHGSEDRKKAAMLAIEQIPKWKRIVGKFYPSVLLPKKVHVLAMSNGWTKYHVGRELEMSRLVDLTEKKVNTLIIGKQGMGKSHLLDNLKLEKVLRVDDGSRFRVTLAGMLVKLIGNDKEKIGELLELDPEVVTKESVKRLSELLCRVTEPKEYTIIIDRADDLTPTTIKSLEILRNHFHFIVAAREVKISAASWLTNFEKMDLKPLNRPECMELITRASTDLRENIEDYEAYKNKIWNDTAGVPQFVLEAIDRFKREGYVSASAVSNYHHTAGRKEIDMSIFIILGFACLMIFRYIGGEIRGGEDSGAFKLIGGAALIFALFARQFFRYAKRKFV